jgi:hypothetical protein
MTDQENQNNRRDDIKDVMKEATKEAIREWLDDKFAAFGKWSMASITAIALAALLWLFLTTHGWKPPQQ